MADVNLKYIKTDSDGSYYEDLDYPDVTWQKCQFDDDAYECVVCDFPIDPGLHFVCETDYTDNAHRWCVTIQD